MIMYSPNIKPIFMFSSFLITISAILMMMISPTATNGQANILYSGETLYAGQSLTYKSYSVVCQTDCNLVVYDSGSALWASNTNGRGRNCYCTIQENGELVVYRPGGIRIWSSSSVPRPSGKYVLVLQKNRNVVVYGPDRWSSNTSNICSSSSSSSSAGSGGGVLTAINIGQEEDNILYTGETLYAGHSLTYKNYSLVSQADCNLVLYDKGKAIWASNTNGVGHNCYCRMERDGKLVLYRPGGIPIWSSSATAGQKGLYVLILQEDRNVVVYGYGKWSSNTYIPKVGNGDQMINSSIGNNDITTTTNVDGAVSDDEDESTVVVAAAAE